MAIRWLFPKWDKMVKITYNKRALFYASSISTIGNISSVSLANSQDALSAYRLDYKNISDSITFYWITTFTSKKTPPLHNLSYFFYILFNEWTINLIRIIFISPLKLDYIFFLGTYFILYKIVFFIFWVERGSFSVESNSNVIKWSSG